jgi:arylformamidase
MPRNNWIDVSLTIHDGMARWPGDVPVRTKRASDVARGDVYTLSELSLGSHTGTHMDAHLHFLAKGTTIDRMPLDVTIGPARVIEIKDSQSVKPEELADHNIRRGERILFKTKNSALWKRTKFMEDFVYLSNEATDFLVQRCVSLVGIDYLSVGGYKSDNAYVHKTLLGAGIWIVEGLDLSQIKPGKYDMVCLPLKLANGDGAPTRVALRPRNP